MKRRVPEPTIVILATVCVCLAAIGAAAQPAADPLSGKWRPVFAYRAVRSANGRSLTIISIDPATRAVLNSVVVYDQRQR